MEFFYVLLILLVITRAFGELAVRLGQPALVGELLSGQILLFLAIVTGMGLFILPRLERVIDSSVVEEFEFSALLAVAFGFAVLAEALHMHFILGAFAAGFFLPNAPWMRMFSRECKTAFQGLRPVFWPRFFLHRSAFT